MAKLTKEEYIQQIQKDSVMTVPEIAEKLGITEPQVRYLLKSAMQKLRLKCIAKKIKYKDCFD